MVPKLKPKSKIEVEGAIFDWLSYYKIPLKIAFSLKAIIYFFKHYPKHLLFKIFGNLLVHFAIIIWCNNKIMKVCFFVRLFRGRLQVLMNTSSDDHYSKNIHYSPFVSHFLQNKLLQVSHQGVENWLKLSLSSIKYSPIIHARVSGSNLARAWAKYMRNGWINFIVQNDMIYFSTSAGLCMPRLELELFVLKQST